MPSIEQVRDWKIDQLRNFLRRTGMYATTGREASLVAHDLLFDLCFIDGCIGQANAFIEWLYRYGKLGVDGAFRAVFGDGRYVGEVSSVYAAEFDRLGYLAIERRLDANEWQALLTRVRDEYEEEDLRRSVVLRDLGEPSLIVDRTVMGYAHGVDDPQWAWFDFWEEPIRRYEPGQGSYAADRSDDPLLRDIRIPAGSVEEGLVLTLYGKVLRWGPGWWIRHPSVRSRNGPPGVAAQLREIDDAEPSKALRDRID